MPNLKQIGYRAFNFAGIEEINLRGLRSLETITANAFSNNYFTGLDFSELTSLKSIGDSAFYASGTLGSLDLSPLTSLTTIPTNAFAKSGITELKFGELPNLTSIGKTAFSDNQLRELDLSGLHNLTSIYDVAFRNK